MKKTICLFSLAFFCLNLKAQENDDIKKKMQATLADKFPETRTIDIRYLRYLPSDFDTELMEEGYEVGKLESYSKLRVGINLPVIRQPKWNITSSFIYTNDAFDLHNVSSQNNPLQPPYNKKREFHTFVGAVSFTYFSTLFGKPFIYNSSLIADASNRDIERLKGFIGGSLVIKRTPQTMMTVGAVVFVDPASPLPFAPTFSLDHKFSGSAWVLDLILPQRLLLKRSLLTNGRISIGSEIAGDGFYVNNPLPEYSSVYNFTQVELRSGLTYEYGIKNVILSFKTGISTPLSNRLTEKGESTSDYILKVNRQSAGYFSIGASYNLFKKKKD